MALKEAVETLQGLRGGAGVAGGQQIIQVVGGGGGGDEPAAGIYDVTKFGANRTGSASASSAIQNAIDTAAAAGGGTVYLPPGTYKLTDNGGNVALITASKVRIQGGGWANTLLTLADGADAHMINIPDGASDIEISDLQLFGNRTHQTLGIHGVRAENCQRVRLHDLYIKSTRHYGIGMQGGKKAGIHIYDLTIEDTGGDGIDFKNTTYNNEAIKLDNILVRRHGQNPELESMQTGIDIRGPAILTNITILELGSGLVGIRFRAGEEPNPSGSGGHHSVLNGFHIQGANGAGSFGVFVGGYHCAVANGSIIQAETGLWCDQQENTLTNLIAKASAGDGFKLMNSAEVTNGDRCILNGCIARDCGDDGFVIQGDNNLIASCIARSCDGSGFNVMTGATGNRFANCLSSSNSSGDRNDGSGTVGWPL
jgi:hypothetical protein